MGGSKNKSPYWSKGFTLIEVLLVLPLIAIVLTLGYNMLFLSQRSFAAVNRSFEVSEQLRIFQINIHNEAHRAKKAGDAASMNPLYRHSATEIHIYTDVNNSDGLEIPELVRYYLGADNTLKRQVRNHTDTDNTYPYVYPTTGGTETTVLKNVSALTFGDAEIINPLPPGSKDEPDYRSRLRMNLTIGSGAEAVQVEGYLVSKSKVKAE